MPSDHSVRAGTLYINAVQKEAEGVYTCLGIGGSGVVLFRADAQLRVMGEWSWVMERDRDQYRQATHKIKDQNQYFALFKGI